MGLDCEWKLDPGNTGWSGVIANKPKVRMLNIPPNIYRRDVFRQVHSIAS